MIRYRASMLRTILLLVVSITFSVIFAELIVRYAYPQRLYYNVSEWDAYVGFKPISGLESVQRNDEYTMTVKINSRGLRDREFSLEKPARTVRIGVFGDSYTFGEGVEAESAYPKVLERMLAADPSIRKAGLTVEVLNFGVGKSGTSHQLAWFEKEGLLYDLDIVVLGFLAANDFTDNISGVFELRDGQLAHNPAAYSTVRRIQTVVFAIPGYRWLAEHSHLVNLMRRAATGMDDRARIERIEGTPNQDQHAVEITARLLERFREVAAAERIEFLVVNLPARGQRNVEEYASGEPIKPYVRRLAKLRTYIAQSKILFVDLLPVFRDRYTQQYYYEHDGHMRESGHVVVAEHLFPILRELISNSADTTAMRSNLRKSSLGSLRWSLVL